MSKIVYLDNNATTRACDSTKKIMAEWIQSRSNPSGSSKLAETAAVLVQRATQYVQKLNNAKNYTVVWTSGATESNCLIIKSIVDAFWLRVKQKPHIISSTIEHSSVIQCLNQLVDLDRLELTYVNPNQEGIVDPEAVKSSIKKNTCLVTIMYANNELGSINPVKKIAEYAHEHKVPFHTDAVQIYGKAKIDMQKMGLDALSMSFHKLGGPPGCGMLIIKNSLIEGYHLKGQISGTQQGGLRGGTENVPAIAGSFAALVENFAKRAAKNTKLLKLRLATIKCFEKHFGLVSVDELKIPQKGKRILILGPKKNVLPNTLLISVIDWEHEICNIKLKQVLESEGIIVSIGSACNTKSKHASHVLEAIKMPSIVKRGVIRISFGDENTIDDVRTFCKVFIKVLKD